MLLYTLMAGLIFVFAFQKLLKNPEHFYPGVLWVSLTFAGTLGVGRLASREQENSALLGMVLAPSPRSALFFSKVLMAVLLMSVLALLEVPLFAFMFSVPLSFSEGAWIFLVLLLGNLGFSCIGTIVSALLLEARGRELLLPVALYPLVLPVIIFGVSATSDLLAPGELAAAAASRSIQLLVAFDLLFLLVGAYLFEQLLVE